MATPRPQPGVIARLLWSCTIVLLLAWTAVAHGASSLGLSGAQAAPGGTALVAVQLQLDGTAVAVQFDVRFDASRLRTGFASAGPAAGDHTILSSAPAVGVARVVIYSLANDPLGNGLLVNLPLVVDASAAGGSVPLTVTNVVVADVLGRRIEPVAATGAVVNILSEAAPQFERPIIANGQVALRLNAEEGKTYTLQVSSDLRTWQNVTDGVVNGGVAVFTESVVAGSSSRFYRAVGAP
jgi:hypothetical protein